MRARQFIIAILVMSPICAIAILAGIYPYRPKTMIVWIILFLAGLPVVLIGEGIGRLLIENQFVAKHGRVARMTYALIVISLWVIAGMILVSSTLFNNYFEPWGS